MENGKHVKIGIPRVLTYYLNEFDWGEFFKILNYEVVYTDDSTIDTFNKGFKYSVNEQCLPIKVFYGHVIELVDKKVDYIFVPQIVSLKKDTYSCPQILGAHLAAKAIPRDDIPPIITVSIDLNYYILTILRVFVLALKLSKNPYLVFKALNFFVTNFKTKNRSIKSINTKNARNKAIGIISRTYTLNDPFMNVDVIGKIKKHGFDAVSSEDIEHKIIEDDKYFGLRPVHWYAGQDLVKAARYFLKDDNISGVIFMNYFGCGIDSFIEEIFKKDLGEIKPYLSLRLDEHTGEAGIITRIEAFIDMISRRENAV